MKSHPFKKIEAFATTTFGGSAIPRMGGRYWIWTKGRSGTGRREYAAA